MDGACSLGAMVNERCRAIVDPTGTHAVAGTEEKIGIYFWGKMTGTGIKSDENTKNGWSGR